VRQSVGGTANESIEEARTTKTCALIVGATSGIGRRIAHVLALRGEDVVVTGRDQGRADAAAAEIVGRHRGLALDLTRPEEIPDRLANIGAINHLVLAAVERDRNSVRSYDIGRAIRLIMPKVVGYTAVVHALAAQFVPDASIVILGGMARDWPYPGSTTITMANGAVTSMVRTLAVELAPVRVNAIHPGAVGDSPAVSEMPPALIEATRARTPTGRLATMDNVAAAALSLLDNPGINGVNVSVDGGFLLK
jgi:NAD(P)-dependent dehydrogenase (short-subunit alcohol dehydrogenase family)